MAGRGPTPKDTLSRPRDQRRRDAAVQIVTADGAPVGPSLPDSLDWPDVTREWWETWRRSAQAKTFTDTDWSFLLDTAEPEHQRVERSLLETDPNAAIAGGIDCRQGAREPGVLCSPGNGQCQRFVRTHGRHALQTRCDGLHPREVGSLGRHASLQG